MKRTQKTTRPAMNTHIIMGLLVAVVALYGFGTWWFHFWPWHKVATPQSTVQTTSSAPSAQNTYPGGKKPIPQAPTVPNAAGTDQNGSTSDTTPPQNTWNTSKDGSSIVVYSPATNSTFTSGSTVFGTATSAAVSYRLSDATSGLLTSGTASVVGGKFSIKLSFSDAASTGNIEIFNQQNPYSPESNNVLIPVRFRE